MTYSELYNLFKRYSPEKSFNILGIDIKNTNYQGRDVYVFVYDKIQYFCLDNFDKEITDDIQIKIFKEVNSIIRKRKIKNILNEDF